MCLLCRITRAPMLAVIPCWLLMNLCFVLQAIARDKLGHMLEQRPGTLGPCIPFAWRLLLFVRADFTIPFTLLCLAFADRESLMRTGIVQTQAPVSSRLQAIQKQLEHNMTVDRVVSSPSILQLGCSSVQLRRCVFACGS